MVHFPTQSCPRLNNFFINSFYQHFPCWVTTWISIIPTSWEKNIDELVIYSWSVDIIIDIVIIIIVLIMIIVIDVYYISVFNNLVELSFIFKLTVKFFHKYKQYFLLGTYVICLYSQFQFLYSYRCYFFIE